MRNNFEVIKLLHFTNFMIIELFPNYPHMLVFALPNFSLAIVVALSCFEMVIAKEKETPFRARMSDNYRIIHSWKSNNNI